MSYKPDHPAAARRHLAAADALAALNQGRFRPVAGYLYGIAAECAIKAMMREAGLVPQDSRREDPFYAHFPRLRAMVLDRVTGRRGGPLLRVIANPAFMHDWNTDMRYCKASDIQDTWIDDWQSQARNVVAAIGT